MTRWVPGGATPCWLLVGVVLVWSLAVPPAAVGDNLGWRAFLTPAVSGKYSVTQRFQMDLDGLSAVEMYAAAVGPVAGRYTLALRDSQAPDVTRVVDVAAADLVANGSYIFRFAPIDASAGHEFFLEIAPAMADPGRGVAFWATKGDRLDEGELRINDRPRWASLAFQTQTPAVSSFRALTRSSEPGRPPKWLALVGLAASWLLLRFVLKAVSESADPAATTPQSGLEAPPAAVR